MKHARVFQSGNSQAVRLPKEFRMKLGAVEIFRRDNEIVLREIPTSAIAILDAFSKFSDDMFADGRQDLPTQQREWF